METGTQRHSRVRHLRAALEASSVGLAPTPGSSPLSLAREEIILPPFADGEVEAQVGSSFQDLCSDLPGFWPLWRALSEEGAPLLSPPTPAQCPPLPHLIIASMNLLRGQPCQPQQLNHSIPWVTREEGMGPQGDFLGGGIGNPIFYSCVCPVQAQGEGQERWAGVLTEA